MAVFNNREKIRSEPAVAEVPHYIESMEDN